MAGVDASSRLLQAPAFVLHTRSWRETSLLVEVLTADQGRLGVVARGLSSARAQPLRAALQPWQWIGLAYVAKGELGQLRSAEPLDTAPRLLGPALLPAFYVNELILRLVPRQDPMPGLYRAYAEVRLQLGEGQGLAWALRRFERDLLAELGLGVDWQLDCDGEAIDAGALYLLDPDHGLRRASATGRQPLISGEAAIALARDSCPPQPALASLRLPMRAMLARHLGQRGLQSWQMAANLARADGSVRQ